MFMILTFYTLNGIWICFLESKIENKRLWTASLVWFVVTKSWLNKRTISLLRLQTQKPTHLIDINTARGAVQFWSCVSHSWNWKWKHFNFWSNFQFLCWHDDNVSAKSIVYKIVLKHLFRLAKIKRISAKLIELSSWWAFSIPSKIKKNNKFAGKTVSDYTLKLNLCAVGVNLNKRFGAWFMQIGIYLILFHSHVHIFKWFGYTLPKIVPRIIPFLTGYIVLKISCEFVVLW
jgi:hypothetical protein